MIQRGACVLALASLEGSPGCPLLLGGGEGSLWMSPTWDFCPPHWAQE